MPDKPEFTREQMAKIESLVVENGQKVIVHPPTADGIVQVTQGGRTLMLDEDGDQIVAPLHSVRVSVPIELLKRMLGADVVDEAVVSAREATFPEYTVGTNLQHHIDARIAELLATSETVETRRRVMDNIGRRTSAAKDAAREAGGMTEVCMNCGHPPGDHQRGAALNPLATSTRGRCRHAGCDCQAYVKPTTVDREDPR